jgi:hypothetical protein
MSYVTRAKPNKGVKKSLRGWPTTTGKDGYISLIDYDRFESSKDVVFAKVLFTINKR